MFVWPQGVPRIPDEAWTRAPLAPLAVEYDAVGAHGWYANLDPTVDEVAAYLTEGQLLVDYSGGTGLFLERLLAARKDLSFGAIDVDSSPKFLALALAKLRDDPRVAFRLLHFLKNEQRLQRLDEALDEPVRERGLDAIVSTNAVHLYAELEGTFASWARLLRPGGRVFVQSGNIVSPDAPKGSWIIDDTVEALAREAQRIVRSDDRFARHRPALVERSRLVAHESFRKRVFLPPRKLQVYLDALKAAGLEVVAVRTHGVHARADEWHRFLSAYSDAVLGWVGGTEKVDGRPAFSADVDDRLAIMRVALDAVLAGRERFEATWTYITATKA